MTLWAGLSGRDELLVLAPLQKSGLGLLYVVPLPEGCSLGLGSVHFLRGSWLPRGRLFQKVKLGATAL